MKEPYVTQVLEDLASREVPAGLDLWPALRARLRPALRERLRPALRARPAPVLHWAGQALLLVALLGTLAYGTALLVRQLRPTDRAPTVQAGLGQPLSLIQAVEGVTISVQHVYVDAESVVIALAISSTDAQRYIPHQITLTNAAGAVLSQTMAYCLAGRPDLPCSPLGPRGGSYLFAFALPPWTGITSTEWASDIHLAVKLEQQSLLTSSLLVSDTHSPPVPRLFIGPFRFDFSLPLRCPYGSQSLGCPPQLEGVLDRMVSDRACGGITGLARGCFLRGARPHAR